MKNIKLLRSRSDKMLSGVCGGIAPLIQIDVTLIRIIVALTIFFTGVIPGLVIYILFAIIMPLEPEQIDINKEENNKKIELEESKENDEKLS